MATIAALQSSITALSLTSSSLLGQRLPTLHSAPPPAFEFGNKYKTSKNKVKPRDRPCHIVMKLNRWERKKCKPNSLPILHKMHVKVGDTVQIISGREKGKIGEIFEVIKHKSAVIIKDMNLKTKHVKGKEQGEPGQIIKVEAPIHSSNVMLYSKEKDVASRVGHKFLEDGTKVRYLIKTGEIIDGKENWEKRKALKDAKETESATA